MITRINFVKKKKKMLVSINDKNIENLPTHIGFQLISFFSIYLKRFDKIIMKLWFLLLNNSKINSENYN